MMQDRQKFIPGAENFVAQEPGAETGHYAQHLFDTYVGVPDEAHLGPVATRTDIRSIINGELASFLVMPEYRTVYPQIVKDALGSIFSEYNAAFTSLVQANREFDTDYQFNQGLHGTPLNRLVQIDMVGLPQGFLNYAAKFNPDQIREVIKKSIFEIENSIAMYQMLERAFQNGNTPTQFRQGFRDVLDQTRTQFGKPIALLAVTDEKHRALRETEFGKYEGESLTDAEVYELSGFDKLFGPQEFRDHVNGNNGQSDYLLYARTSLPTSKLRKPDMEIANPLLSDTEMRRTIKAYSLTHNVDNPDLPTGTHRINDTKEYLPIMGMAYPITNEADLGDSGLREFLVARGIDPSLVETGDIRLRAKPTQDSYGGYGHFRGKLSEGDFRRNMRRNLKTRGPYVLQPEMNTPVITNSRDGKKYTYIDRNFLSTDGKTTSFIGGVRMLLPADSDEALNGRIHGNHLAIMAPVT